MHRHGYRGRKLGRKRAQRKALLKSLAIALVDYGYIETTLPKAQEVRPYLEKVITKAKKGDLHSRRQVISRLGDLTTVDILYNEILPAVKDRNSGYLRIEKTNLRRGDGAQMARVSFVDNILETSSPTTPATKTASTENTKEESANKEAVMA